MQKIRERVAKHSGLGHCSGSVAMYEHSGMPLELVGLGQGGPKYVGTVLGVEVIEQLYMQG